MKVSFVHQADVMAATRTGVLTVALTDDCVVLSCSYLLKYVSCSMYVMFKCIIIRVPQRMLDITHYGSNVEI